MKGITNATKGPADVIQTPSKVSILDTDLQTATDTQVGLMSATDHATLSETATRVETCESDIITLKSGKQDKLTAGTNISIAPDGTISASGGSSVTSGTGISVSGNVVSLAPIGSSKSAGGSTSVPVIKTDQYGRVTSLGSSTIYPPTTSGMSGQYWKSDGSGTGVWTTPASSPSSGSTTLITAGAVYTALKNGLDTSKYYTKSEVDALFEEWLSYLSGAGIYFVVKNVVSNISDSSGLAVDSTVTFDKGYNSSFTKYFTSNNWNVGNFLYFGTVGVTLDPSNPSTTASGSGYTVQPDKNKLKNSIESSMKVSTNHTGRIKVYYTYGASYSTGSWVQEQGSDLYVATCTISGNNVTVDGISGADEIKIRNKYNSSFATNACSFHYAGFDFE